MNIQSKEFKLEFNVNELECSKFLKTLISMKLLNVNNKEIDMQQSSEHEHEHEHEHEYEVAIDISEQKQHFSSSRIPNTSNFLENKFPKAIIDEHFDDAGAVNIDDLTLNLDNENIVIVKDFACPSCYQGILAKINKEFKYILNENEYVFNISDQDNNIMCILDNELLDYICDNVDADDIISEVYNKLKEQNSHILFSDIMLKVTKELLSEIKFLCPICGTYENINLWMKASDEARTEKKCKYCGAEKWLKIDSGELECENKKCYTNEKNN